jgi:hypothetical protein
MSSTLALVLIYFVTVSLGIVEPIQDWPLALAGWLYTGWLYGGVALLASAWTEYWEPAEKFIQPGQYLAMPLSGTFFLVDWMPAGAQHALLLNPVSRYAAWDFTRRNWDEMAKKYPDNALPRMCEAVVALLDREEEVKAFFATHRVRLGAKIIDQHLERLSVAVGFRSREGATLTTTLAR